MMNLTKEQQNHKRAEIAAVAIESMPYFDTLEYGIIDLMANLMHLAKREHLDAWALIRLATNHFEEEIR